MKSVHAGNRCRPPESRIAIYLTGVENMDRPKGAIERQCLYCGEIFFIPVEMQRGNGIARKHCSKKCAIMRRARELGVKPRDVDMALRAERSRRRCAHCGATFHGDADRATYCSRECYFAMRKAAGACYRRISPHREADVHAQARGATALDGDSGQAGETILRPS